jgi:hypothetical protein
MTGFLQWAANPGRGNLKVVRAAVSTGIVVQDVRELLRDVCDDIEADSAGFFLWQVHHHVDNAVGACNVDGNILQVKPMRLDRRLKQSPETLSLGIMDTRGFSLSRVGPV